jgi:hypothetical protein
MGPTGQGGEVNFFSPKPSSLSRKQQQHKHLHFLIFLEKTQIVTKSYKIKYHFAWIFTLIMNLSLDFTVNVCIERKVRKKF